MPRLLRFAALTAGLLTLSGCGLFSSSAPEEKATLYASRQDILEDGLTLYDAVALSLQAGLDNRVDDMDETATPVAESADPMEQSWMTLDRGIDSARQARIDDPHKMVKDHQRKAAWAIIQDTETAYRRAVLAREMQPRIQAAIGDARARLDNPSLGMDEKAALQAGIADLESLGTALSQAQLQLGSLLGIEISDSMKLASPAASAAGSASGGNIRDLEHLALLSRPEIQNGKRLRPADVDELRDAALEKFPGIRDVLNGQDGNRLSPEQWSSVSAGLSKSLTRIFTLPVTIAQPDIQVRLAELRQQALSATIMAQVHLASERYDMAMDSVRQYQFALSDDRTLPGQLRGLASETRARLASIAARESYNGLLDTLGVDMLPDHAGSMTLADLSSTMESRFRSTTPDLLDVLIAEANDSSPDTKIAVAHREFYQHPDIVPAAFHPTSLALKIPLAQKIFRQENPSESVFHSFSGQMRPLKISESGVRNLLDAPITEP
jgi:hypothetical protein